jgi:hypothetical protein
MIENPNEEPSAPTNSQSDVHPLALCGCIMVIIPVTLLLGFFFIRG